MRTRPATPADIPAIVDLCCRYEQEVRGFPDTDEDDIAGDWKDPGFDAATQTLVLEQDGVLVGYATVRAGGEADTVAGLAHREQGLEDLLLDWLEQQAGRFEHYVPDADTGLMRTFARRGWEPARRFWRMRIDFPGDRSAPPEPRWPAGVHVRDFDREADPETVHQVITEAFREIGGQQVRTFEQWSGSVLDTPKYDASLYLVAVGTERSSAPRSARTSRTTASSASSPSRRRRADRASPSPCSPRPSAATPPAGFPRRRSASMPPIRPARSCSTRRPACGCTSSSPAGSGHPR